MYYCPWSHSGKIISIFALLLNLWTPVCLMCLELQHRCHSLSYVGRHLTGCSRNTEKTPPLKLVCAAHEGEKSEVIKDSKVAAVFFSLLYIFVSHFGAKPVEISHSD